MLIPCSSCDRHVREVDTTCPFCGASQRVTTARAGLGACAVAAAALGLSACAVDTVDPMTTTGMTTTTQTDSMTTMSMESGSGEGTDTDTSTTANGDGDGDPTTTSDTSLSFYAGPPQPASPYCDPYLQDCPEGEKCVPRASAGSEVLDENACVPITGEGEPGDVCLYGGVNEAIDDCGPESFCYFVDRETSPLEGVCTAFCRGSADSPDCDPGSVCVVDGRALSLCAPTCDPILQDCAPGFRCAWAQEAFTCVEGAAALRYCDLGDGGDACGAGDCVPMFADASPELADLGVCADDDGDRPLH